MTEAQLDTQLDKLQSETINNGGIFRFVKLPLLNKRQLEEFAVEGSEGFVFTPIAREGAKTTLSKALDHWAKVEGPAPERRENSSTYESSKRDFLNRLFEFLGEKKLNGISHIENTSSLLNVYLNSGSDHLNEDFLFECKGALYLLHLGFSS